MGRSGDRRSGHHSERTAIGHPSSNRRDRDGAAPDHLCAVPYSRQALASAAAHTMSRPSNSCGAHHAESPVHHSRRYRPDRAGDRQRTVPPDLLKSENGTGADASIRDRSARGTVSLVSRHIIQSLEVTRRLVSQSYLSGDMNPNGEIDAYRRRLPQPPCPRRTDRLPEQHGGAIPVRRHRQDAIEGRGSRSNPALRFNLGATALIQARHCPAKAMAGTPWAFAGHGLFRGPCLGGRVMR